MGLLLPVAYLTDYIGASTIGSPLSLGGQQQETVSSPNKKNYLDEQFKSMEWANVNKLPNFADNGTRFPSIYICTVAITADLRDQPLYS